LQTENLGLPKGGGTMWRFLKVGLDGGLIAFRFVLFATLEVDLLLWPPEFEHSLRAPTQNSSFQHSSSSKAIGNFVRFVTRYIMD